MRQRVAVLLSTLVCASGGMGDRAWAATQDTCVACHQRERDAEMRVPVAAWRESVHAGAAVSCDGCHGGDPRQRSGKRSMSNAAGFLENPSWREMADYCGVCHEAVSESWLAGSLGKAMRAGVRVPTCATCHMGDGHRIVEAGAADIDWTGRCRSCSPLEDAAVTATLLQRLASQRRSAGDGVGRVDSLGIDASDLRGRLRASRAAFSLALHRFEPEETPAAERRADAELAALREIAQRRVQEAFRRRRYGLAVLSLLAILFASLVTLHRRLV